MAIDQVETAPLSEQSQDDLFDTAIDVEVEELFSDPVAKTVPPHSDKQIDHTARLAAVSEKNSTDDFFDELVAKNKQLISQGEEAVVRQQAKNKRDLQKRQAINDVALDSLLSGDRTGALDVLSLDFTGLEAVENPQEFLGYYDLELDAVETLQNDELVEDPEYGAAQSLQFAEDLGQTLKQTGDGAAKSEIFSRALDEYAQKFKDVTLRERISNFGGIALLPFYELQGRLNVNTTEQQTSDLRPGATIRRQIEDLWNLPVEEFGPAVEDLFTRAEAQSGAFGGVNEDLAMIILTEYSRGTIGKANETFTDIFAAVDSIPVAGVAAVVLRAPVKSLVRTAKLAGSREIATNVGAREVLASTRRADDIADGVEVTQEGVDTVAELMPTALRPSDNTSAATDVVPLSAGVSRKLDEINQLSDELGEILTEGRLSDDQLNEVIARKLADIQARGEIVDITDFEIITDLKSNLSKISYTIGNKKGNGYASAVAAKGQATRRGIPVDEIVEQNGRYFIKTTEDIEELAPNGFPLNTKPTTEVESLPGTGPFRAALQNPKISLGDDLARRLQDAEIKQLDFVLRIIKPIEDAVNAIGRKGVKQLDTVMTKGRKDKRWYNIDEFVEEWKAATGKNPKESHWLAYQAAKKASDIDYAVHNNKLYTDLVRRGVKQVNINRSNFKVENAQGTVIKPTPEQARTMRFYDVEDDVVHSAKADTPARNLDELDRKLGSGDYEMVRLREGVSHEGDIVHTVLVKKGSTSPLNRVQLNYTPGGHLMRRTKWFAKQARTGKYKDGDNFVLGPNTVATYRTERTATEHVAEINRSLAAYRELTSARLGAETAENAAEIATLRGIISEGPFDDLENMQRLVDRGKLHVDHDFEAVFDRAVPSFYVNNANAIRNASFNSVDDGADSLDGTNGWLQSTGRDYYGKRTEGLMSPHEDKDVLLDPLASIARGLQHSARTHSHDAYFSRAVEEWVRQAAPFIDRGLVGDSTDARHIFFNGTLNRNLQGLDPATFDKLTENRILLQRQMGLQTPSQKRLEVAKRQTARFVEDAFGKRGTQAVKALDNVQSNNPINAVNAFIFDAWLGMFDLSQLFVQTQTIASAIALSPKFGVQAASMLPTMRWLTINKSDNFLDFVANKTAKLHGQDVSDFKDMMKEFRKSAWNKPGGEVAFLDQYSNCVGAAGSLWRLQQGRRGARIFFNEAERWNRMTAYQIAWKETRAAMPDALPTDARFIAQVNKRTSDFSLNMTSANNSKIQRGVFSPMTRFMGYQMRLMEALLPVGGGKQFTAQQKARLWASQLILYGSAGMPFGRRIADYAGDMVVNANGGQTPDQDLFPASRAKMVESGVIDTALFLMGGADLNTDFAQRAGFGTGFDFTMNKIASGESASMLELAMGPASSFTSRQAQSWKRVIDYFKASRADTLTAEDALFVFDELVVQHINSLRRADKAFMIWKMGQVIDKKSGRPLYDASKLEAAAAFIGIPLWEDSEMRRLYSDMSDQTKAAKGIAEMLAKIDRRGLQALMDGEDEKARNQTKLSASIFRTIQDDPELLSKVQDIYIKELGYTGTEWSNLLERAGRNLPQEDTPQGALFEDN